MRLSTHTDTHIHTQTYSTRMGTQPTYHVRDLLLIQSLHKLRCASRHERTDAQLPSLVVSPRPDISVISNNYCVRAPTCHSRGCSVFHLGNDARLQLDLSDDVMTKLSVPTTTPCIHITVLCVHARNFFQIPIREIITLNVNAHMCLVVNDLS